MSDFVTLLIKDLMGLIAGLGTFAVLNSIMGKKLHDITMQAIVFGIVFVGFSGGLATHYGNIHTIKARIIATMLAVVVFSITLPILQVLRHRRVRA